jgi:peptidoglycan/LPS O-acetylase OafA/YrhL
MKHSADWDHLALPTHVRIDTLFSGVALGYIYHFDSESFGEGKRWWVLAIGLLFSASLVLLPDVPRLSFAYIVFAFIVAWAANQKRSNSRVLRALAWIGFYSYSLYLWHGFAMVAIPYIPVGWYRLPVYLAIVLVFGVGLSKLIEIPALKLRDRLFPTAPSRRFMVKSD